MSSKAQQQEHGSYAACIRTSERLPSSSCCCSGSNSGRPDRVNHRGCTSKQPMQHPHVHVCMLPHSLFWNTRASQVKQSWAMLSFPFSEHAPHALRLARESQHWTVRPQARSWCIQCTLVHKSSLTCCMAAGWMVKGTLGCQMIINSTLREGQAPKQITEAAMDAHTQASADP